MKLSNEQKAYIAGFLDGDGSIHVRLKPNSTYRFRFQISPSVVFYQSKKEKSYMQWLKNLIGRGYIRERKDGIVEYIIGDLESIKSLLESIKPYLRLKKRQANLMLKTLSMKEKVKSAKDFVKLSEEIDKFQKLNYSKKRIQNSLKVKKVLKKEGFLAP
ncbi:LAGLIDADG family homing endonuclease [Patescibacteria group bacterium]|nr:LAGLIDADG family homing endonuclease [Patescibacteria group bacterium]